MLREDSREALSLLPTIVGPSEEENVRQVRGAFDLNCSPIDHRLDRGVTSSFFHGKLGRAKDHKCELHAEAEGIKVMVVLLLLAPSENCRNNLDTFVCSNIV